MIGNLRCCNSILWGDKDLCHCWMDVSWLHDTVPSKIKSNLNCCCQLTCDDWGIPNTKLKYYQCTSAALLCCKNKQLFNCIWQMITHEWWIWIVPFIPRCYQTSFWSRSWFCAFEILVALATKTDLGAVFTQGVWAEGCDESEATRKSRNRFRIKHDITNLLKTLRLKQYDQQFVHGIFICVFLEDGFWLYFHWSLLLGAPFTNMV